MKLNKDCVRDVLIYIENYNIYETNNLGDKQLHIVTFEELCESDSVTYNNDIIYYTLEKMEEYGLIKFNGNRNHSNIDRCFINYHISEITVKGHELLDNIKDDKRWNKLKTAMKGAEFDDCSLNIYIEYIYNETRKCLNN